MIKVIWTLLVTLTAAVVYYLLFAEGVMPPRLALGSDMPFAIGMMFAFYLAGKIYCNSWKKLDDESRSHKFYSVLALPVMSVVFPIIFINYSFAPAPISISKFIALLLSSVLLLFLLADLSGAVDRVLTREGIFGSGERASDNRYFFLQYPPKGRIDLLPQDILINGVWLCLLMYRIIGSAST